jgi:hypothetical protein
MSEELENLTKAAFSKLSEKANLDDLEKAASIAKYAAEAQKAEIEAQNARGTIWGGIGKHLSNIVVPIASLVAVVTTFWIQSNQVSISRQQIQDTEWREFLGSINKSPNYAISEITFVPRLKSFLHSNVYKEQVVDVAKRLLGQLTDRAGFDDLINVVFPPERDVSLSDMKDVLNSLQRTDIAIQITCNPTDEAFHALKIPGPSLTWGLCDATFTDHQVLEFLETYPDKNKIIQARRDAIATAEEEYDVTRRLLAAIKILLADKKDATVDMSGVTLMRGDLTGIDLKNVVLTEASCERCDFTGTVLQSERHQKLNPQNSNWWDADKIDKDLLELFISEYYPGYFERELLVAHKNFSQGYYIDRITKLCAAVGLKCSDLELKFVEQNFSLSELDK